jgi:ArsR family transcriptional regulator
MATVTQPPAPTGLTQLCELGEPEVREGQGVPAECYTTSLTRAPLSADDAERLVAVLKAIAVPARLRLLSMIYAHEGAEACVCELTGPLGLTQPTVSHHLKVLVDAGLLTRSKRGVWAYYQAVPDALTALAAVLTPPPAR